MVFILYGQGKLDLKFLYGRAKKWFGSNKVCPNNVYTSEAEIPEENSRPRGLEKMVCLVTETCFGKQLLLQINICCWEMMQNNKITSLMGQPLLDDCSI